MSRALRGLAVVALAVALFGCGGDSTADQVPSPSSASTTAVAGSSSPTPVTTEVLDSIAVLGHSGATGTMSDPKDTSRDAHENSWATGENPAVRSIYFRLLQTHPAMQGHNYNMAVNGTAVDNLVPQLDSLLQQADPLPDVVIVQSIDNDMKCDGTDAENYGPYGEALKNALTTIGQKIPGADLFLVSQWGTVANWTAYAVHNPSAVLENSGTGPCDVFTEAGKIRPAGVKSLQAIVDKYWAVVETVCASVPRCFTDHGTMQSMRIKAQDVASDGNHLAIPGHAKMAAIAWKALPAEIKHRD
jgi:hypothetical protein